MKHPFTFVTLLIAMAFSVFGTVFAEENPAAEEAKAPVQVALMTNKAGGEDVQTIASIVAKDPSFQITEIDGQQVRDGALDKFDILIFAGNSCDALVNSLRYEGIGKVKEFIKSGKCYMGLGGGAFFTIRADLINAQTISPKWERGSGDLKIETTELGCAVFDEQFKGEHDVCYTNGMVVNLNIDQRKPHVEVLAKYTTEFSENDVPESVQIGSPAIMLSTYGKGTTLVFGVHPERTEAMQDLILIGLRHLAENSRFGKPVEEIIRIGENAAKDNAEALRKVTLDYMTAMAEVEWIPEKDIVWWRPKDGVMFHAGEKYKGLPYTQPGRYTTLEQFQAMLEIRDGKPIYIGPIHPTSYRGSDCSSSCSMAWQRTIPNCPIWRTARMNPGDNCLINPKTGKTEPMFLKVGSYVVPKYSNTADACEANGKDVMFACYNQLLPGDAIVRQPLGHVRMVVRVDPEKKIMYTTEQTGLNSAGTLKSDHQSWRVNYAFTYDELFKDGYLPITPMEYNRK